MVVGISPNHEPITVAAILGIDRKDRWCSPDDGRNYASANSKDSRLQNILRNAKRLKLIFVSITADAPVPRGMLKRDSGSYRAQNSLEQTQAPQALILVLT